MRLFGLLIAAVLVGILSTGCTKTTTAEASVAPNPAIDQLIGLCGNDDATACVELDAAVADNLYYMLQKTKDDSPTVRLVSYRAIAREFPSALRADVMRQRIESEHDELVLAMLVRICVENKVTEAVPVLKKRWNSRETTAMHRIYAYGILRLTDGEASEYLRSTLKNFAFDSREHRARYIEEGSRMRFGRLYQRGR